MNFITDLFVYWLIASSLRSLDRLSLMFVKMPGLKALTLINAGVLWEA